MTGDQCFRIKVGLTGVHKKRRNIALERVEFDVGCVIR